MSVSIHSQSRLVDVGIKAVELKVTSQEVLNNICNGLVGPEDIIAARAGLKACLADSRQLNSDVNREKAKTAEEFYGLLATSFPRALEAADQMVAEAQRMMVTMRPATHTLNSRVYRDGPSDIRLPSPKLVDVLQPTFTAEDGARVLDLLKHLPGVSNSSVDLKLEGSVKRNGEGWEIRVVPGAGQQEFKPGSTATLTVAIEEFEGADRKWLTLTNLPLTGKESVFEITDANLQPYLAAYGLKPEMMKMIRVEPGALVP